MSPLKAGEPSSHERGETATAGRKVYRACCLGCAQQAKDLNKNPDNTVPRHLQQNEGDSATETFSYAPADDRNMMTYNTMLAWNIIRKFMDREHLEKQLPKFVSDTHSALLLWVEDSDGSGIIHPLDLMRRLIFYLSLRVVSCPEIVNARDLRERALGGVPLGCQTFSAKSHVQWVDSGLAQEIGRVRTRRLDRRTKSKQAGSEPRKRVRMDPMEEMLDQDLNTNIICSIMSGAASSSMGEIGSPAGWTICFIGQDRRWYARVQKEVDSVIAKHRQYENEHPVDVLRRLPLDSWRTEFTHVNVCIFHTFKVHKAMRGTKAMSGTTSITTTGRTESKVQENGEVVQEYTKVEGETTEIPMNLFKFGVKWNPAVPNKQLSWDDLNFQDEDNNKVAYGTIFDKLQVTITTIMFVAHYNFSVCDRAGNPMPSLNQFLDKLDPHMPDKVYLKVKIRIPAVEWNIEVEEPKEEPKVEKKSKDPKGKDVKGKKKKK